jgi:Glycosyl transferase family 2
MACRGANRQGTERLAAYSPAVTNLRPCFITATRQSKSFQALVEALRAALEEQGVRTTIAVDHFPGLSDDVVFVFCPHEYLPFTYPEAHPSGAQIGRTVVLNTKRPGTQAFKENALTARHTGVAVDVNPIGATELRRQGTRTWLLRLGYVPTWEHWNGRESPRPIDVAFVGDHSPRRGRALAACGPTLKDWRCAIHLADPVFPSPSSYGHGESELSLLVRSKVLLSIHEGDQPYFDWQLAARALGNGCVLATEHSVGVEPLVPGEHYVSTTGASLPYAVAGVLQDTERLNEIRTAAHAFLREELPLSGSIAELVEAIEQAGSHHVHHGGSHPSEPLPSKPVEPEPHWVRLLTTPNETDVMRMALKRLVVGQQRIERRLGRVEEGADEQDRAMRFGPFDQTTPRVTVAVTLYNYEGFIAEALESVALSDFQEFEVVLVDDASTDDSLRVAEKTFERFPWLAGMIIARGANGGLPAARNLAIEQARGEYVFILDADNLIYPHALGRLAERLDEDAEAGFAYGILEKFDATGPYDLLSWPDWDPKRLRHGNFVDAMSMVRRSAFAAVGGYTTDPRLGGWEDLALWCSFVQAGMRGSRVPEILARYRAGRHSMISVTNIDASEAWSVLLERFPFLRSSATPS